jgi:DNA-binding GntR family transcriptional regulator
MRHDISPLAARIALDIIGRIESGRLRGGDALRETALAEAHQVSRSPIRETLRALTAAKLTRHQPNRGTVVTDGIKPETLKRARQRFAQSNDDEPYRRIAADHLAGILPTECTEAEISRRYKLGRAKTRHIIAHIAQEGWIERRPGYGWAFLPVLTTPQAFSSSYRFRLVLEPAALLEPTFKIDEQAFARFRAAQQALVDGDIQTTSSVELFRLGSAFHEMLAKCSGNPFFFDALQRINRLRRLIEYRAMVDTAHFIEQAHEHLKIMDLIESGDMEAAASFLARHLETARAVKLEVLTSGKRHADSATAKVHF